MKECIKNVSAVLSVQSISRPILYALVHRNLSDINSARNCPPPNNRGDFNGLIVRDGDSRREFEKGERKKEGEDRTQKLEEKEKEE